MLNDGQEIFNFLIAKKNLKDVSIDENDHDQSLTKAQNILESQIPTALIPISVVGIDKFYDLQDKFKIFFNSK